MKKLILFIFLGGSSQMLFAQGVGINTIQPHPSAALEIKSSTKGLLIPGINLQNLTDNNTISNPAHSLLIYNVNESIPGGKGYYLNAGSEATPDWKRFNDSSENPLVAFGVKGVLGGTQPITSNENQMYTRILFSAESYDLGNNYSDLDPAAPSSFTVPAKGVYHFDTQMGFPLTQYVSIRNALRLSRIRNGIHTVISNIVNMELSKNISLDEQLEQGDQVIAEVLIWVSNNPPVVLALESSQCFFSGRLVIRQ
jgi:hypothetical protein